MYAKNSFPILTLVLEKGKNRGFWIKKQKSKVQNATNGMNLILATDSQALDPANNGALVGAPRRSECNLLVSRENKNREALLGQGSSINGKYLFLSKILRHPYLQKYPVPI